jgi:hypothetical protein
MQNKSYAWIHPRFNDLTAIYIKSGKMSTGGGELFGGK